MIYNNLYKIHDSTWDNGTVGHLGHFCKDFSNDYTFPTSWIRLTPSPVLEIIQLHDDVVSRDKIIFRRRNFKQKKRSSERLLYFYDRLGGVNLLFIDSSKSKDACCRNRRHTNVKTPKTRAQTAGLRVTNRLFATGYM